MKTSIDELDGTETLEELEALLAASEQPEEETPPAEPEAIHEAEDTPTETDEDTAPSAAGEGEQHQEDDDQTNGDDEPTKGVASKNGKHIIPYEVLEAERAEAKRLRDEVEQLRAAQAERDKLQALLEKNGIAADSDELSMEQIEQLAEDYPDVGKALVGIARKLNAIEQQKSEPAANPVLDALDAVPDLKQWQANDPDRFTFAVTIDDRLKTDPAFADKPLAERFAEAARRTRIAFGDEGAGKPAAKTEPKPKEVDDVPPSPGDMGQSARAPTSQAERYQAMSQEQLMAEMATMTPAQIEALLAEQGL